MTIEIDKNSGFCFGVINAIKTAEKHLNDNHSLYCLGDIVHNNEEVNRLCELGLVVITYQQFKKLQDTTVLIRAHGEPPETYTIAQQNNITLIDATCQVVLKLQKNIKKDFENSSPSDKQILIFGKKGHAEVIGLVGQTNQTGIIISSLQDIDKINYEKPSVLYSQTTQSLEEYSLIIDKIKEQYRLHQNEHLFSWHDTICRLVANRSLEIQKFAKQFDTIIFVSGEKSSNGLYLFDLCKKNNPNSFLISHLSQLDSIQFTKNQSIGICGATSTPLWLMQKIENYILQLDQHL